VLKIEILFGIGAIILSIIAEAFGASILLIPAGIMFFAAVTMWIIHIHRS